MAKAERSMDTEREQGEPHLNGTFASVLILGGILAASWITVFIIFLVRNGG